MATLPTLAPAVPAAPLPPVVPGSRLLGSALDLRRDMLGACERAFRGLGDAVRFQAGPPGLRMELYLLFHLGRHRDAQRRVREEVAAVVGDRVPTARDAQALAFTTMALKEAMRLYPSAPLIGRRAVGDDELSGYRIPAGTNLALVPWVIHRHPGFWDEPERFDPERFTPERERARHRYAWTPFGGGPRACIGQHFSVLESVLALAMLVREFEFAAPAARPPYTNHITLRPTRGVPSRVSGRVRR